MLTTDIITTPKTALGLLRRAVAISSLTECIMTKQLKLILNTLVLLKIISVLMVLLVKFENNTRLLNKLLA